MKFGDKQRRLYLLAAVLLLITLALCAAWSGSREVDVATPDSPPATVGEIELAREVSVADTVSTVVYYQDDYGYLVPVMRRIQAEEGIAKATVNLMVKSVYNDMEAARLGLRTVIPENTTFDLDISGGLARIDLSKEVMNCADAVSERNMIDAIVNALTDFPTVDKVSFLVGGRQRDKLTHGTVISGEFDSVRLNLEGTNIQDGDPVTLYFTNDSPALIVPVTRFVYGSPDIQTAVLELVKGPSSSSPLEGVMPSGCGLLAVEMDDGVAKLSFTEEFIRIAEQTDGGRLALRALTLTCKQFEGVKSVEILVNGKPYDTGEGTLTIPTFVNTASDVADAFIQTQSNNIFDFD